MVNEKFIKPDKIKHNIAGISKIILLTKQISGTHISRKWIENRGCQGRLEAASNILICDYLVSRGIVREFLNLITVVTIMCGKHSHDQ